MTQAAVLKRSFMSLLSFLVTVQLSVTLAGTTSGKNSIPIDCGTLSLYNLLRLENVGIELSRIEAHLPARSAGEHSMKDVLNAAKALGIKLKGVTLRKEVKAIDQTMIVFLKRGEHGHFLVIRPVGHTGKLVQVIDSAEPPDVIDKA